MSQTPAPEPCRECGFRGRYQRYGSWYCERHVGLAERYRDRDAAEEPSPDDAGTPERHNTSEEEQ